MEVIAADRAIAALIRLSEAISERQRPFLETSDSRRGWPKMSQDLVEQFRNWYLTEFQARQWRPCVDGARFGADG